MAGLLDFLNTPEGQGLLSATFGGLAGARRGAPLNSIGRAGLAGLAGYSGAQDRQDESSVRAQNNELRQLQIGQARRQVSEAERAAQEKERINALIRDTFSPVTGTNANAVSGVTGPRPEAASVIGTQPAVNFQQLIALGVPPETAKALADAKNYGRSKVARTIKGMGPDGREYEYQVDEFGAKIDDGFAQYRSPLQINQGDRQTFADPYSLKPVGEFGINQSADSKASQATAIRGQNMADARARERFDFDKTKPQAGKAQGPMSVTLQKELLESDDAVSAGYAIVQTLEAAKRINKKAYSGYGAKTRAVLASNLTGGTASADATIDIDNMMTGQALESLKTVFGGMPTEGERKILLDIQASVDKTPAQREAIMDRAIAAAKRRADYAKAKAKAIREGTYLTDGAPEPMTSPLAGGASGEWEPAGAKSSMSGNGWSATLKK